MLTIQTRFRCRRMWFLIVCLHELICKINENSHRKNPYDRNGLIQLIKMNKSTGLKRRLLLSDELLNQTHNDISQK